MITTLAPGRDTTVHAVRRRLASLMPEPVPLAPGTAALELQVRVTTEAPALREAEVLEGKGVAARAVPGPRPFASRFGAFLDGAQWSHVVAWAGGVPIVHGTVAAVIRSRHERRLRTWELPVVRRALYAPLPRLSAAALETLRAEDLPVVDTLHQRAAASDHPFALQELAHQAVLAAREAVEQDLARRWCANASEVPCLDGGVAADATVARAENVVGVVKSHQHLFATPDALPAVMGLKVAERTSVVRVAVANRTPVASWYLRLRDTTGHDPLWGLVRVEIALPARAGAVAERADEVSRWILAEVLPLAVPDPRWDKMVYGIRDCEEYLRAIQ